MTEVERIVKKGVVSEDFLKEEIKNDFLITVERKKLWAVILDLVVEFDKVCKKHNLTYYLDGGSLLGAVRHNGIIPWDDDIDVTMPREDYERFLSLGNEFEHPYFLQTPYTDTGYYYSFVRLRNSNTTALNQMFKYQGFNQGIWISIFPLDKFSLNNGEEVFSKIKELNLENSTYMRMKNPFLGDADKKRVENYSGRDPMMTYEEIQKLACQYNNSETDYWGTIVLTSMDYCRKTLLRKSYERIEYHKFENLLLPIPAGYDDVLKTEYGDYMIFPPVNERSAHNEEVLFDSEHPYTEYLKQLLR